MRKAFSKWELLAVVAGLAVIAALVFPFFGRAREGHNRTPSSYCMSNLKQIGLGFMQYIQDYDEKFPMAETKTQVGWTVAVQPYIKSWQLYYCPSAIGARKDGSTDYFYNSRLVKFPQDKVENVSNTILSGEGAAGSAASYAISSLPKEWIADLNSPANRHVFPEKKSSWFFQNLNKDYGANYLFADGHVKRLKPKQLTLDNPKTSGNYTFLPR